MRIHRLNGLMRSLMAKTLKSVAVYQYIKDVGSRPSRDGPSHCSGRSPSILPHTSPERVRPFTDSNCCLTSSEHRAAAECPSLGDALASKARRAVVQSLLKSLDLGSGAVADLTALVVVLNGNVQAGFEQAVSTGVTTSLLNLNEPQPRSSQVFLLSCFMFCRREAIHRPAACSFCYLVPRHES